MKWLWILGIFIFFSLFIIFLVLYLQEKKNNSKEENTSSKETTKKVTVELSGGLGNQLFEIAAGLAYATSHSSEFVMDHSVKKVSERSTYFDTMYPWVKNEKLSSCVIYQEPAFHYVPIPDIKADKIKLQGYFQSEKYFKNIKNEIKDKFLCGDKQYNIQFPMDFDQFRRDECVCMHIRRTDYVNSNFHTVQDFQYYKDALQYMKSKYPQRNLLIVVFSDDMKWCRENLKNELNDSDVEFYFIPTNIYKDYEELILMSKCDHNIIANSSFSWWGAYLNENPHKTVIAPKKWFDDPKMNWQDIYCPEWIVL